MNDVNKELESVMRRIQKLLAIAGDKRADPNEAAAAAYQAEKLMAKFQLDNADVVRADLDRKDSMTIGFVQAKMKKGVEPHYTPKKVPLWASRLGAAVARLHNCIARIMIKPGAGEGNGAVIAIAGYKSDVQIACWTFDYLADTIIANLRFFQKQATRTKAESESFRAGFAAAIFNQLRAAREMNEQQPEGTGRDLMIIKIAAVEEKYGEAKYQVTKSAPPRVAGAFQRGVTEGMKVDVGRRAISSDGSVQKAIAQ